MRASTTVPVTRPVTGCAADSKGSDKTNARQREISKVLTTIEGSWASRSTVEQKAGQLAVGLHCHDVALAAVPMRVDYARSIRGDGESRPRVIAEPCDVDGVAARQRCATDDRLVRGGADEVDAACCCAPIRGLGGTHARNSSVALPPSTGIIQTPCSSSRVKRIDLPSGEGLTGVAAIGCELRASAISDRLAHQLPRSGSSRAEHDRLTVIRPRRRNLIVFVVCQPCDICGGCVHRMQIQAAVDAGADQNPGAVWRPSRGRM